MCTKKIEKILDKTQFKKKTTKIQKRRFTEERGLCSA
jgi:hypothetical protein